MSQQQQEMPNIFSILYILSWETLHFLMEEQVIDESEFMFYGYTREIPSSSLLLTDTTIRRLVYHDQQGQNRFVPYLARLLSDWMLFETILLMTPDIRNVFVTNGRPISISKKVPPNIIDTNPRMAYYMLMNASVLYDSYNVNGVITDRLISLKLSDSQILSLVPYNSLIEINNRTGNEYDYIINSENFSYNEHPNIYELASAMDQIPTQFDDNFGRRIRGLIELRMVGLRFTVEARTFYFRTPERHRAVLQRMIPVSDESEPARNDGNRNVSQVSNFDFPLRELERQERRAQFNHNFMNDVDPIDRVNALASSQRPIPNLLHSENKEEPDDETVENRNFYVFAIDETPSINYVMTAEEFKNAVEASRDAFINLSPDVILWIRPILADPTKLEFGKTHWITKVRHNVYELLE